MIEKAKGYTKHDFADSIGRIKEFRRDTWIELIQKLRKPEEKSKAIDMRLRDLQNAADDDDINLLGLVRRGKRLPGAARNELIRKGYTSVMEGAPQALEQFLAASGLEYAGDARPTAGAP